MLGNFTFHNPTKLYFGENSLENLGKELGKYGEKVMLVYGGGSIRKNGIYDTVLAELRKVGKQTVELSGVMPNPTIEKVMEGAALAKKEAVDLILAVGGGSVCDYCKAVAGSAYCEHDPWEYYFNNFGEMTCRWIPVGCVLTMAGTGSEMDSCSVISKHSENRKKFYYFRNPDFSILNPVYTYTVPRHHTVAGIYDIMSHILEQYLSGTDDNTTDYIAEGLMRSLVVSSRKVLGNPEDYEARSNIMWTATWALNGFSPAVNLPTGWYTCWGRLSQPIPTRPTGIRFRLSVGLITVCSSAAQRMPRRNSVAWRRMYGAYLLLVRPKRILLLKDC